MYQPERMKEKQRKEFLEFYETQKDVVNWSYDENIVIYCDGDVFCLVKSITRYHFAFKVKTSLIKRAKKSSFRANTDFVPSTRAPFLQPVSDHFGGIFWVERTSLEFAHLLAMQNEVAKILAWKLSSGSAGFLTEKEETCGMLSMVEKCEWAAIFGLMGGKKRQIQLSNSWVAIFDL